jgi:asparagine synthase (glutamine-hydrolysing)
LDLTVGVVREPVLDIQLLLEAYRRDGAEATAWRWKEFSFGMRDGQSGEVFCARDLSGVHPLYYCSRPGEYFAFAAEVEPLLALPGMERRLNRLKAAVYLAGVGWNALDASMTFFEGIHRLPPGHLLIATCAGVTVRRYATFHDVEELSRVTLAELSEELLARLRRAVQRRTDSAGLLLSGGLKSASIAALASGGLTQEAKLPCWSFVPVDAPGWTWPDDPRPALEKLKRKLAIEVHPVGWREWGMADDSGYYPEVRQQPIWFYIREDEMAAMAGAEQAGLTALMTGMGGQWLPIFRRPPGVAWAAIRSGDWRAIAFDGHAGGRRTAREAARLVKNNFLAPLLSSGVCSRLGIRPWSPGRAAPMERRSLIRESFLEETGAAEWMHDRAGKLAGDFRENAYEDLARGGLQLHLENWALLGRRHGLEFRYPFLDPEVVDFCFRLPASYHLGGDSQQVLREAMRGLLPEPIRTRRGRLASVTDWPYRKVRLHVLQRARLAELERHPLLSTMVDLSPIHQALDQFPCEANLQDTTSRCGLLEAARQVNPGGVPTTVEYFRSFAQFLDRNGFR